MPVLVASFLVEVACCRPSLLPVLLLSSCLVISLQNPFWLKPFWLKPFLVQDSFCFGGGVSSEWCSCGFRRRIFMRLNRKFVLEDDLQQAVWRNILRGPRPPSVQWGRMHSTASAASKPNHPKPEPLKKDLKVPVSRPPAKRRETVSPDEAASAARKRVAKIEASNSGRRGRNLSHAVGSIEEGAVAGAGATCIRANRIDKEFLLAVAEAEGERSPELLLTEERATPSPFTAPPPPPPRAYRFCRGKLVAGHRGQFTTGDCTVERWAHSSHSGGR